MPESDYYETPSEWFEERSDTGYPVRSQWKEYLLYFEGKPHDRSYEADAISCEGFHCPSSNVSEQAQKIKISVFLEILEAFYILVFLFPTYSFFSKGYRIYNLVGLEWLAKEP